MNLYTKRSVKISFMKQTKWHTIKHTDNNYKQWHTLICTARISQAQRQATTVKHTNAVKHTDTDTMTQETETRKHTYTHSPWKKRTETTQWHAMTHTKQVKLRNKNLNNDKHNDPPTHQIAKRHTQSQKGTPYSSYNETHNNTQYYLFKFNLGKF